MLSQIFVYLLIPVAPCCGEWDFSDFELFDLVEEVNQSFYELLQVPKNATVKEIKKSYRQLSLKLHPDRNSEADAEIKFRQLTAVHDILRDDEKRKKYEKILEEGLPNWKQPVYYFRRVKKLSITELLFTLCIIFTVGQYGVSWASYYEKQFYMPQRRKHSSVHIPKPSYTNLWPFQLWSGLRMLVFNIPQLLNAIHQHRKAAHKAKLQKAKEQSMPKFEKRTKSWKAPVIPEIAEYEKEETKEVIEIDGECHEFQASDITGGFWEDSDVAELAQLMKRYPGGYSGRWEIIAKQMHRSVYEVTRMAKKMKENDYKSQQLSQTQEVPKPVLLSEQLAEEMQHLVADGWTQKQQHALEHALVTYPKGTMERWDRIADAVEGKDKEECLKRFKYLAHLIKIKKQEAESSSSQHH